MDRKVSADSIKSCFSRYGPQPKQRWLYLGACQRCRLLDSTPDVLNQNLLVLHHRGSGCAHLSWRNTALKHNKYWIDRQVVKLNKTHPPLSHQNFSHTTNFLSQPCFFSSAQSLSHIRLCDPIDCSTPGFLFITNSQSLLKFMSIESVMPSNLPTFCHPLLLLPSIFSSTRVFSNESVLRIRWPKYWSFSFSISPSNEHPGLISFRMDWLDLPAVQGTLKSLLQLHSSEASILQCSALFMVQLSHPHMTTGKNHSFPQEASRAQRAASLSFVSSQRHLPRCDFFCVCGCGLSFFGGSQSPPTNGCSTASCRTASPLAGRNEPRSFYSDILSRKPLRDIQWNVNKPNLIAVW